MESEGGGQNHKTKIWGWPLALLHGSATYVQVQSVLRITRTAGYVFCGTPVTLWNVLYHFV